jgi:hypothetical protein
MKSAVYKLYITLFILFVSNAALSSVPATDNLRADSSLVFHFDFKNAAGKKDVLDTTEKFHCISQTANLQVEKDALRIAPGAVISIPSKGLPDLTHAVTMSAWILKSSTPDVAPILMKGNHPEPIEFLFGVGWRYPSFTYKNIPHQSFWKGISTDGFFGSSIKYHDPAVQINDAPLVEYGGTWYHVASVFDNGSVKLFVNGVLEARYKSEKEETLANNNSPIYVGIELLQREGKLEPYATANMLINDLELYNRAFTDAEIQTLYSSERSKYPTQSQIPPGKTHTTALAPSYAYLGAEYDPLFQRTLDITQKYEKHIPTNPFLGKQTTAKVQWKSNTPQLAINQKTEYPMAFFPSPMDFATAEYQFDEEENSIRDFAAADVNIVGVGVIPTRFWLGDGQYDWAKFDEFFQTALVGNPSARILVELPLYPAPWFEKEHPEQMEKYFDGSQMKTMTLAGPLGSDLWLATSLKMIHDVVTHIEESKYAGNVFAYLLGGGQSSEWYWPGGMNGPTGYSVATQQSFQNWLRKKYNGDVSALRKAWSNKSITFQTATVPSPTFRAKANESTFFYADFYPAKFQQEIDFREYLTASTAHQLSESARAVKEACNNNKLVFAYHGYAMSATGRAKLATDGLQGLGLALSDPNIDCIATLIDYVKRRGGQAGLSITPFYASARLHHKMIWEEHDYRTHVARGTFSTDKTDNLQETLSVLTRSVGMTLAENAGVWWRAFQDDWYHQGKTMETIAAMKRIGESSQTADKTPVAQVALIYDENTPYYQAGGDNAFLRQQVWGTYEAAARMGAPYDMYLLSDLKNKNMPDYKLYIFLNAYYINASTRKMIDAKVRKNNAVSVWCYAPGFMGGNSFLGASMKELTGMNFVAGNGDPKLTLQITDRQNPITRHVGNSFPAYDILPAFAVTDPDVKVLGTTTDGPALVVKEFPNWRSVYSMMPLNQELLQGLCDYAGVHIYSRSYDVLYANKSYVFLYTSSAGNKTISLASPADVQEEFSGKKIGEKLDHFTDNVPTDTARIYRLTN